MSGDELVQKMDEAGVDAAVAFPMGGFSSDYDYSDQNDIIVDEMHKYPGKILGFCRINPNVGPKAVRASVDRYIGEKGMLGIKLQPEIDHFRLTDEKIFAPVFEAAQDHRAPIIFHSGGRPGLPPRSNPLVQSLAAPISGAAGTGIISLQSPSRGRPG